MHQEFKIDRKSEIIPILGQYIMAAIGTSIYKSDLTISYYKGHLVGPMFTEIAKFILLLFGIFFIFEASRIMLCTIIGRVVVIDDINTIDYSFVIPRRIKNCEIRKISYNDNYSYKIGNENRLLYINTSLMNKNEVEKFVSCIEKIIGDNCSQLCNGAKSSPTSES